MTVIQGDPSTDLDGLVTRFLVAAEGLGLRVRRAHVVRPSMHMGGAYARIALDAEGFAELVPALETVLRDRAKQRELLRAIAGELPG